MGIAHCTCWKLQTARSFTDSHTNRLQSEVSQSEWVQASVIWICLLLLVVIILIVAWLLWILLVARIPLTATVASLCRRLLLSLWLLLLLLWLCIASLILRLCLPRAGIWCHPGCRVALALWSITWLTSLAVGLLRLAGRIRRCSAAAWVIRLCLGRSGGIRLRECWARLGCLWRILRLLCIWRHWRYFACWSRWCNILLSWQLHWLWRWVWLWWIPLGTNILAL